MRADEYQSQKCASQSLVFKPTGEKETADSLICVTHPSQESRGDGRGLSVNATMRNRGEGYRGIYEKKSGRIDSNCEKREGEKEHWARKG